jgi:hypothetical protein
VLGINAFGIEALLVLSWLLPLLGRREIPVNLSVCPSVHPLKWLALILTLDVYYFLVVLYGCETFSLILKKEHRLRVLRRIFGPKKDEVTGK